MQADVLAEDGPLTSKMSVSHRNYWETVGRGPLQGPSQTDQWARIMIPDVGIA